MKMKFTLAITLLTLGAASAPVLAKPAAVRPVAPVASSEDTSPAITSPERRQALRGSALVMHPDDGFLHDHE